MVTEGNLIQGGEGEDEEDEGGGDRDGDGDGEGEREEGNTFLKIQHKEIFLLWDLSNVHTLSKKKMLIDIT